MAESAPPSELSAQVVVAGAGPAGLMAALLFARAGASVLVLESHADFLRDFRGDTVHPSTLALFDELGCLLAPPHDRAGTISATFSDVRPDPPTLTVADFSRLGASVPCPFVAMMPQDAFLSLVDARAAAYGPARYRLVRNARVVGLLYEDPGAPATSRVVGVRAAVDGRASTELIARATALVVAADGRRSAVRAAAALPPAVYPGGAPPIDVLWFRLPRDDARDPPGRSQGFVSRGAFLVSIYRGTYMQMGMVIAKGGADAVRDAGLRAFAQRVAAAVPYLDAARVEAALPRFFGNDGGSEEGGGGRDVYVLDVRVDRLTRWWRPGLICIGDAAHAMSPVGGVGINLAVQDAVALANRLAARVAAGGKADDADLAAVQRRREMPTRATQALQVAIQSRVLSRVLRLDNNEKDAQRQQQQQQQRPQHQQQQQQEQQQQQQQQQGASEEQAPIAPPLPLRLMARFSPLHWIPARLIGVGFRPEHIQSPEAVV